MLYTRKPRKFSPRFEVVSCLLEWQNKILLLHRQDHKPEGDTWCVPAGKVETGENLAAAMIRELYQETGLELVASDLEYRGKVYVKYPDYDFVYHVFYSASPGSQRILINRSEHKAYRWVPPRAALNMNLIQDEDECIKRFLLPHLPD